MRSVLSGSESGLVVGESGDVVDDGGEPRVEGRVEVGRLEGVDINFTQAVELACTSRTTDFLCDGVKSLVDGGVGWAGHGIGAHLDGTLEPTVGVVPEVMVDLNAA